MTGAGKKDKWITIQGATSITTDGGEVTETWTTFATVWGLIKPLASREAWQAKQSQATTTHTITIHYLSGVTSRMRATWGSRTFNFESVVNINEQNRELVITATEVTA